MLPVLVLDPAETRRLGRNPRRAAYFCGAVSSLGDDIAARGSRLICRRGPTVATVLRLVREARADSVAWSAAYDAETLSSQCRLQSKLEEAGIRASIVHDAPAVPPDETAAARSSGGGRGYRALAPYVAAWTTAAQPPLAARVQLAAHTLPSESLPHVDEYRAGPASSGERPSEAGTGRAVAAYLAGPALQYLAARNVPAGEPTSRLSAALSFGLIAARTLRAAAEARKKDRFLLSEERLSLDALLRALAQRDFFLQLGWFFEAAPDVTLQRRMRDFPFAGSHPALAAWREGRTGYPFVDAGLRQLKATGWMHPRARLVAASFLCFDLGVDWRVGRDAWDTELLEDDSALANGNWQWVAGVGADLAQFPRIYNPRKQARSFDPAGRYARRWIAELVDVPGGELPGSRMHRLEPQLPLPLFGGACYPAPVVEHETCARAFLGRYAAFVAGSVTR